MKTQAESKSAYDRLVDSQPILDMLGTLSEAGLENFNARGYWEVCLCALILRLEPRCKVHRIIEALPYKRSAYDGVDVLNTMAHLGYYARPSSGSLEDIDARLLPGLFVPESGTPCIVLGRDIDDELQFYDPVSRLVSGVPPAFDAQGKLWFFQPYDETRKATSKFMRKGSGHTWFRALLGRFRGTFAQVMTAGLILNLIALVTPLFIMLVYDRVIASGTLETLPMLALGAAIALAFEAKLRNIRSSGLSWLAGRLDNIVSNRIFAHLIGLPPSLIESASVAAQIARIKTFESVRDFFSGSVFLSLIEAPFVVLSVLAIACIAGKLVFVPLMMVAGYAVLFLWTRRYVKVSIRIAAKASSARQQFTIETFEKLEGIRTHGLGAKWLEKFRHLSGREMMAHFTLNWHGLAAETGAHALTLLSAVATVGFGVHMIWAGDMTTGALVAVMILVWRVLTPFYSLCTMVPRLEQLRNSIMQVNDLIDIETEAELARSRSRLAKLRGRVTFQNAGFRYSESSDTVFSGLTFDLRPGEMAVVTGGNGTGKSTILKLIKGMYRAEDGTVSIDGFDIRQLDAPDLRRQIAYVPKIPTFFTGTLIENLRISNPLARREDVVAALQRADVWDAVRTLPNGLDTIIGGPEGASLTASQTVRLSLARAYLHPAGIVLIDELPNALLSSRAGANLKEWLREASGKRTIIMITYREDFRDMADLTVEMRGIEPPIVARNPSDRKGEAA